MMNTDNETPITMLPTSMKESDYNEWFGLAKQAVYEIKKYVSEWDLTYNKIKCRTQYLYCWVDGNKMVIPSLRISRLELSEQYNPISFLEDAIRSVSERNKDLNEGSVKIAIIDAGSCFYCTPIVVQGSTTESP